ncbi:VOC family protein [Nocardia seriolae]|nr:VOC family protein [Nocardia seriolae]
MNPLVRHRPHICTGRKPALPAHARRLSPLAHDCHRRGDDMPDLIPGTPRWFDVTAPDIAASAEFYTALFGWTARDLGLEAGHYTLLFQDDAQVAGIMSAENPDGTAEPAIWLPYFTVADTGASVAAAVDAGAGVLMPPTDVFGRLEFAVLADPDGAPYGVSRSITDPGTERWGQVGNPMWIDYAAARTPSEAMAHYAKALGWTYRNAGWETATENPYQALSTPATGEFGGVRRAAPGEPAPRWSLVVRVADADAVAARAVELGGTIVTEPADGPGPARTAVLADPAGAVFSIMFVG